MKTNNLIIIGLLIVIILMLIAGIAYFTMFNTQNEDLKIVNNTTVENTTDNVVNATLKSSGNSVKQYDDWQKDYETGEYDEYGSPIYRSVISTSGGQNEPGIYEAYWSENGPISEERIG